MNETDTEERWTQEEIADQARDLFRGSIRFVIEFLLQEEVKGLIGAKRYERFVGRAGYRNGSYLRRLLTEMGLITVEVPKVRGVVAERGVLPRYERRRGEVDAAIREAYVSGVSTRSMSRVTEALMGERVSPSTVSRISKSLDEEVEKFRRQPLSGEYPYLFLDATFLDVRWARSVENVSALVAYGVDEVGKRRLLSITLGCEESEASWAELLEDLVKRGLRGVRLVVADSHEGLKKAVRRFLPQAETQRCVVHFMRNILAKVPYRIRGSVAADLRAIFYAKDRAEAERRASAFEARWGRDLPEAVAVLRRGLAAALVFFGYPKEHWLRIRTTNGLERFHREVKRRTDAVGAFPDRPSALRLVTAVALRFTGSVLNHRWGVRRYLDMSLLERKEVPQAA